MSVEQLAIQISSRRLELTIQNTPFEILTNLIADMQFWQGYR